MPSFTEFLYFQYNEYKFHVSINFRLSDFPKKVGKRRPSKKSGGSSNHWQITGLFELRPTQRSSLYINFRPCRPSGLRLIVQGRLHSFLDRNMKIRMWCQDISPLPQMDTKQSDITSNIYIEDKHVPILRMPNSLRILPCKL
jgi:hypothetical protein